MIDQLMIQGSRLRDDRGTDSRGGPRAAADLLQELDQLVQSGNAGAFATLPTGFQPLDRFLGGGLRPGNLILVGGAQSVGKTTLTLQMARNLACAAQASCAYVCYEHEELYLLERLITLEAFLNRKDLGGDPPSLADFRSLLLARSRGKSAESQTDRDLVEALSRHPGLASAVERVRAYGQRLHLMKGSGVMDDVETLRGIIRELKSRGGPQPVVFVDYLQKLPVFPPAVDELDGITRIANGLKDLALSEAVPIVAVVAADREGLQAQRLRMFHLRGSAALSYEADVVLILNNKFRIVAKSNITYNYHQAQEYRGWVVCTIEKNRSGPDLVDLEFRSAFGSAAFDPSGRVVADTLIEERIDDV